MDTMRIITLLQNIPSASRSILRQVILSSTELI